MEFLLELFSSDSSSMSQCEISFWTQLWRNPLHIFFCSLFFSSLKNHFSCTVYFFIISRLFNLYFLTYFCPPYLNPLSICINAFSTAIHYTFSHQKTIFVCNFVVASQAKHFFLCMPFTYSCASAVWIMYVLLNA